MHRVWPQEQRWQVRQMLLPRSLPVESRETAHKGALSAYRALHVVEGLRDISLLTIVITHPVHSWHAGLNRDKCFRCWDKHKVVRGPLISLSSNLRA